MKKKISICSAKSSNYVFINFMKQFRKAMERDSIGQMLNSKQVLSVLRYMGFVDQQYSTQDHQLAKTITKMLSDNHSYLCVKRTNLFKFLTVLCDITQIKDSLQVSHFQEQTSGLALDIQEEQQPLIVIQFGYFDQYGKWNCSQAQKEQIKSIFASMKSKRISRNQVQSRKKLSKEQMHAQQTFQPKICPKSNFIAEKNLKNSKTDHIKVENRLILSRNTFKQKISQQLNKSLQKQISNCTFKPFINRIKSKQNVPLRSNSQDHLKNLLGKGAAYKKKQQKLRQLKIKINQSIEMEGCTFKPHTTKHTQLSKCVYVRNRDKEIQRLREGRKRRQYVNQIKQRGYPTGINWSQYLINKGNQQIKTPILCIDLKILNQQYNINVFDGENVITIAQRISKEHNVPEGMWWKVQELVRRAIQQCNDIKIQNNKIHTCS